MQSCTNILLFYFTKSRALIQKTPIDSYLKLILSFSEQNQNEKSISRAAKVLNDGGYWRLMGGLFYVYHFFFINLLMLSTLVMIPWSALP